MKCPVCQSNLKDGTVFCTYCGTKLDGSVPLPDLTEPEPSPMNPQKKNKGALIAIIVILFLVVIIGIVLAVVLGAGKKESRGRKEEESDSQNSEEKASEENTVSGPTGSILEIKVQDADGNVLPDASVIVYVSGTSDETAEETTDENGMVSFDLEPQSYHIVGAKEGYVSAEVDLNMSGGDPKFSTILTIEREPAKITAYTILATDDSQKMAGVTVRVKSPTGQEIASAVTSADGYTELPDIPYGEYTVVFECDGYYSMEKALTVDENREKVFQQMVPTGRPAGKNSVLFMVEWEGDQDLDLCLFNSGTKEYVTISNTMDDDGNFLYADHKGEGDMKYELICMRDKTLKVAQTLYVLDTKKAQLGEVSDMERLGVKVTVFDGDDIDVYQAKESENAAVWQLFYYYMGSRYEDNHDYIGADQMDQVSWVRTIKK
ncbi:MAG: carboxypeptidase regulatory-like domain-containing protein [Lachnospiraceae bacterium]|nr:carboxypeptidase regulatory-like domain-containing protein [Lachnospiraceae bacterium]